MTIGRTPRRLGALLAAAVLIAGCGSSGSTGAASGSGSSGSSGGSGSAAASGGTLVVDTFFDLKTVDPGREFEFTGNLLTKAMYDTLLTFSGGDVTKLEPDLASYQLSSDAKTLTLTLTPGRVFSDGSPVTADDVVFSLDRVAGIKGNPSFLMDGVTVTKKDDKTVVLTSDKPNPALPYILPSPALSIVNSKVVKEHGGTTTDKDDAEKYLNSASAGSGPYLLSSLNVSSQAKLVVNPKYNGDDKPTYSTIVVRNVQSSTQKLNVQKGDSQVALDLSGDQVTGLPDSLNVISGPSAFTVFLLLNQSPEVSKATANADFDTAVKKAIDYQGLLKVAGKGSVQAAGIVPSLFAGALPPDQAMKFDLAGAKAALAKSGMADQKVKLSYPNDVTLGGLSFQTLAERLQAQLAAAGIQVNLAPAPVATELDPYRNGKEQIGLWYWGPDYPDAADYLAFGPGGTVGLRANWKTDAAITAIADKAATTSDPAQRKDLFVQFQEQSNASGPFVPLVQPATNIVTAKTVTGAVYNPVWTIDLAALGKK
jgi:peptide/nickel transport system substrate-binding protein